MRPPVRTLTSREIANIKEEYLTYNLDGEVDLKEFADEVDIPVGQLNKYIKDYRWDYHREAKKQQFENLLAQKRDIALDKAAVDIVETQTRFLRMSVDMVNEQLPIALESLKFELENGLLKGKELISAVKLLSDVKFRLMDKMEAVQREQGATQSDLTALSDVFKDPVLVGELVQAASKDEDFSILDNDEWEAAMEDMER